MHINRKLVSLLLVMAMLVCECASVFAAGSKKATPVTNGGVVVSEETGSVVNGAALPSAGVTSVVVTVDKATSTGAGVVVNELEIASAINQLATTKSQILPPATQNGSTFMGYLVTLANGKTKKLKKITAKMLSKLKIVDGKLELTPYFKLKVFKVKIAKVGGVAVPKSVKKLLKKRSYKDGLNLAEVTKAYEAAGKTVTGYRDERGNVYSTTDVIYDPSGVKAVSLIPIFGLAAVK